MSEDTTNEGLTLDEYNKDIRTTSGIFGELPASAFVASEENPAGVPAPQQVTPGADYHPEPEDLTEKYATPTVEDREQEEEGRTFDGPAHAAQAGIADPTAGEYGTTQTTASPEDQANLAGVDGNDVSLGGTVDVKDEENKEEEANKASKDQADKAVADDQPNVENVTDTNTADKDSSTPKRTTRTRKTA